MTCKHTYTNSRGSISSPDFPEFYPSDSYCEYRIIVSKDMRVHLSFTNFTLESVSSCRYDYVQLLDSDTDYGRLFTDFKTLLYLQPTSFYCITVSGFRTFTRCLRFV